MNKLVIAGAVVAVLAAGSAGFAQQGSSHQGHHSAGQPSSTPAAPQGGSVGQNSGSMSAPGGAPMHSGGAHGGMMHGTPSGHAMPAPNASDRSPATLAYQAVNSKMHEAMNIPFTGDADRDFAAGMIAHHEGAIDMAKVVLAFGRDPEIKKLAEQIIKDQEKEVAWMRDWLNRAKK